MARAKKRADGRYRVTLTVGKDKDGKPIRKEFYSRISISDAKKQRTDYMLTHRYGGDGMPTPKYDGSITLDKWTKTWIESYKASLSRNSFDMYTRISERFCDFEYDGSRYGDRAMDSFLPMHITTYLQSLSGMSKSLINLSKLTITQIFKTAKTNGLIDRDFSDDLTETVSKQKVKGTYVGHKSLTREHIDIVNQYYANHRLGGFVMTMIWSGCRPGEVAALTWDDIDFGKGIIHVNKSLDLRHKSELKSTKTESGNRDIPMFAPLRKALFRMDRTSEYVFTRTDGKPFDYQNLFKCFDSFCGYMERVLNGVPHPEHGQGFRQDKWMEKHDGKWETFDYTLYDLRDTFCTTLYDAGVDLKTAQKLMGHADPQTTLKIYTKLSEERQTDSVDAMESFIERMYSRKQN